MADNWDQTRLDHRAKQSEAIAAVALSLLLEHGASALTMAAIAGASGVSRQTLYRYYSDIDAVLVGVARLVAAHDDSFEAHVVDQADPVAQLDVIVGTVSHADGHGARDIAALRASLPPPARELLANHEDRTTRLLADVLQAGIDDGVFRGDIQPTADAPLILGLAAAGSESPERALALIHRMVEPKPKEK